MFARRNGIEPTARERRQLYAAFLASYALLFVSFHTGPSADPLIRSLGIPLSVAAPLRTLLLIAFGGLAVVTMGQWIRRAGAPASLAPFVLVLTQATWFVAPAIAEWARGPEIPQTRYVTGVLALMHPAQYLWITSYYARREAAAGQGQWRPWTYAATLVAGGISLFIPAPWFASYLFHTDFTQSVLIVTSIVNIHHFILDGAVWKLRDTRVAALDQTRFIMGSSDSSLSALTRASALNPYDSSVRRRTARLLVEQKRYDEAYAEYERFLRLHPRDGEALLNLGVLAMTLGRRDEAVDRWMEVPDDDPARPVALRYIELLRNGNRVRQAAPAAGAPPSHAEEKRKTPYE